MQIWQSRHKLVLSKALASHNDFLAWLQMPCQSAVEWIWALKTTLTRWPGKFDPIHYAIVRYFNWQAISAWEKTEKTTSFPLVKQLLPWNSLAFSLLTSKVYNNSNTPWHVDRVTQMAKKPGRGQTSKTMDVNCWVKWKVRPEHMSIVVYFYRSQSTSDLLWSCPAHSNLQSQGTSKVFQYLAEVC